MAPPPKLKVSLTLSADLVSVIDRNARRSGSTRSSLVEQWLRRAASASVEDEIRDATASYYLSIRNQNDHREHEALARGLSAAARRVSYDSPAPARRRRQKT